MLTVVGIALATVASNALSAVIVVAMLLREEDAFRLEPRRLAVDADALKTILHIGLPAGLQSMVFSLSNVIIQAAINSFGSDATAGAAAGMNYEYCTYFFVNAFSQAAVTFIGQNYAAGNLKRCDAVFRICMTAAVLSATVLSAVFVGLGDLSLEAFTTEAGALGYGAIRMLHVELLECLTSSYEVTSGAMRGMGWSVLPTIVVIAGSCLLRIAFVLWLFPLANDYTMLMCLYPVTWTIIGATMIALNIFARHRAYGKARMAKAKAA